LESSLRENFSGSFISANYYSYGLKTESAMKTNRASIFKKLSKCNEFIACFFVYVEHQQQQYKPC